MALQGQKTKSDYLEWEKFQILTHKLERDGEWKFTLLINSGCYLGLRISDLLNLRWEQVSKSNRAGDYRTKDRERKKANYSSRASGNH